jgi:MYXO-CTERM domain-containing protein
LTPFFDFDISRFMKTRSLHRKPASIAKGRWAAYATAGAASAFTCANSAEATIHYSGRIGEFFGSEDDKIARFQLDQPGDSIRLRHSLSFCCTESYGGDAFFSIRGRAGNAFAGFYCPSNPQIASVSKLNRGQLIAGRPFLARNSGVLASLGYCAGQFDSGDLGFIGFKFNNGSGDQYGWVRIRMITRWPIDHDFWLVDYAYADPGEPIRAGQKSSNETAPEEGSLGWLALGAVGLLAWRKRRSRAAR